jgi:hypothetical protein
MKNVLDPKPKLTWVTVSRIKTLKLAAVSNITLIPEQSINLALAA